MSEQQPLLPAHNHSSSGTGNEFNESPGLKSGWTKWRHKTACFLEHPALHRTVIALIAIDASCVLADLAYSFLSEGCTPPGGEGSPAWLEVLSHISLGITTLFLIEIPLTVWALGFQYMNPFGPVPHASLHAFDAMIILTTFTLEVILRGKERELAGLLVVLRLWRLVKLVGGVAVGAGELGEENAEILAETRDDLEQTKAQLAHAQEENLMLRQKLSQFVQDI